MAKGAENGRNACIACRKWTALSSRVTVDVCKEAITKFIKVKMDGRASSVESPSIKHNRLD